MRTEIPPERFAEWFKNLPPEKVAEGNKQQINQAREDWNEFRSLFNEGICSICRKSLNTFSDKNPCLHWLLRPKGFKKKHFPLLYDKFTYFRIVAYVRWVASIDGFCKNINDIKDAHPGGNLTNFTARHKHITWSFSCCKGDFEGHPTSVYGNFPHYHMKMNLDGKPFITYSDFHVPFHKDDLYYVELITKHPDIVKHGFGRGAGMEELLGTDEGLEAVIKHSISTDDYEGAAVNIRTIVMAPEGETIPGSLIDEAYAESKATGKTVASIIRDKLPDAIITSIVSPGLGVPESQQRAGGRKKKNDIGDI